MKRRKIMVIAAALMIVSAATVGTTISYFTDTKQATGGITLSFGDSTITPHEEVEGMVKHVTVENTGNYDVFLRVKAVYGSNYTVELVEGSSDGWTLNSDGYYYYSDVVASKATAPELVLEVGVVDDSIVDDEFNIVIVQEATPAVYDSETGEFTADWTNKVMSSDEYSEKFSETTTQGEGED